MCGCVCMCEKREGESESWGGRKCELLLYQKLFKMFTYIIDIKPILRYVKCDH